MDDGRLVTTKEELHAALLELDKDKPNERRVLALLNDANCGVVDFVDGGISAGCSRADLNQVDAARQFINRATSMMSKNAPKEWMYTSVQQFIGKAIDHLQVVLSGNVHTPHLGVRRDGIPTPEPVVQLLLPLPLHLYLPTPNQGNIMSDNPIVVDITPARRRFGRKPRKQWQFRIAGANGEPLDARDTYANVGDVTAVLLALRHRAVTVRVHYAEGVQEMHWAAS